MIEEKFQRMDELCNRMELVTSSLAGFVETGPLSHATTVTSVETNKAEALPNTDSEQERIPVRTHVEELDLEAFATAGTTLMDHIMASDSSGRQRFIGGSINMDMIEAMNMASPIATLSSTDHPNRTKTQKELELPWFAKNGSWPKFPYLPRIQDLPFPQKHISDLLINTYFDRLNSVFPLLFRPDFLRRYQATTLARDAESSMDLGFLSIMFAVFACGSGLMPREPGASSTFTGLRYYEAALALNMASTGHGFLEQVQCLGLLSLCTAGWNTLAQSWKFAGSAVRAAQDLGLHRARGDSSKAIRQAEVECRVWWCVYSIDRLLSLCLGRPSAADDQDCDCRYPMKIDDTELERSFDSHLPGTSSLVDGRTGGRDMSEFATLIGLCQLAGSINRAVNPIRARSRARQVGSPAAEGSLRKEISLLDQGLSSWVDRLAKLSPRMQGLNRFHHPNSALSIMCYILHASCVITLYRPLITNTQNQSPFSKPSIAQRQCIDAARSCILICEHLDETVAPSHYLAFGAHYLMLSGIILYAAVPHAKCVLTNAHRLRLSGPDDTTVLEDVQKCLQYLKRIEEVWTGVHRSRIILEEIYSAFIGPQRQKEGIKRPLDELSTDDSDVTARLLEAFNQEDFNEFLDGSFYQY
ncbi:uncharacterized protein HMPREF1541_08537 [Cyphellophora europaea CBS 101466]|uniref:Xylanolytic transcriptional activator regulatory domain-containing protein n=1 Tax=Cyphellophora europaea (strain CBS 101466) TaxID=1220924 RepID=W2RIU1_CYPE1|nr:uncharacterized protein HMPREF1541_08537 [Cyphellophora europaea CBS 101466]ETN36260.1 hypothetical protein HMPREF1541_08537 [Cyphellophora europaea CBS 101466]